MDNYDRMRRRDDHPGSYIIRSAYRPDPHPENPADSIMHVGLVAAAIAVVMYVVIACVPLRLT